MKPIRQAIFNVQKEMRLNGDSKELQHVLDLLCKIEKGEKINFAHSCEKLCDCKKPSLYNVEEWIEKCEICGNKTK